MIFKDRNGKKSIKRVIGTVIVVNGLLMSWYSLVLKSLIIFKFVELDIMFEIDTTLIIGIITAGVGLLVGTVGEKQNIE